MTSTSISGVVRCPQEEAEVTQTCLWRGRIGSSGIVILDWIYWDRAQYLLPTCSPLPMLLNLGGKGAAVKEVCYCLYYCKGHTLVLYYSLICVISLNCIQGQIPPRGSHAPSTHRHDLMLPCLGLSSTRRQPRGGEKTFVVVMEELWEYSGRLPSMAADSHTVSMS